MTNPDNVGGLPTEPFAYFNKTNGFSYAGNSTFFQWCLDQQRSGRNEWPGDATFLYTADQMRAYGELCRAAPAGVFAGMKFTEVRIPQGYALDIAQAGVLAIVPQAAPAGAETGNPVSEQNQQDSAPAGSGEVSRLELARMELAVTAALFNYEQGDTLSEWLKNTAALLRKLQQGAE